MRAIKEIRERGWELKQKEIAKTLDEYERGQLAAIRWILLLRETCDTRKDG